MSISAPFLPLCISSVIACDCSQNALQSPSAAVLQCSQECYSRYENGQRELPLNLLCRLAEFYGTSTDYLLGLTDDPRRYW